MAAPLEGALVERVFAVVKRYVENANTEASPAPWTVPDADAPRADVRDAEDDEIAEDNHFTYFQDFERAVLAVNALHEIHQVMRRVEDADKPFVFADFFKARDCAKKVCTGHFGWRVTTVNLDSNEGFVIERNAGDESTRVLTKDIPAEFR